MFSGLGIFDQNSLKIREGTNSWDYAVSTLRTLEFAKIMVKVANFLGQICTADKYSFEQAVVAQGSKALSQIQVERIS